MCNMEQVQGSGQLELVLRFIRKAARNLTDAYAIQVGEGRGWGGGCGVGRHEVGMCERVCVGGGGGGWFEGFMDDTVLIEWELSCLMGGFEYVMLDDEGNLVSVVVMCEPLLF